MAEEIIDIYETEETRGARDTFRVSLTNCVRTLAGLVDQAKAAKNAPQFLRDAKEIAREYWQIRAVSKLNQRELEGYDLRVRRAMQYFEITA